MTSSSLSTHPLHRADGSATLTTPLFTILAACNGPVEVQRRDELPEQAALEVNVRPASGVGGPRERWLESVLTSLLRSLVLVHLHPRTLVQVTLQIVKEPGVRLKRGVWDVAVLEALANASFAALVDGGVPLGRTMVAALGVVTGEGRVVCEPGEKALQGARSVHVVAYSASGEILLSESVGRFGIEEWKGVVEQLKSVAMVAMARSGGDVDMEGGDTNEPWLRNALEESVREASKWREVG